MAKYSERAGYSNGGNYSSGDVEHDSYCMPSMQQRNVDSMNKAMGYLNMSDLANTPYAPTQMKADKVNKQLGPKMPSPGKND